MAADGGHDGGVEVDALLYLGGIRIPGHDEEVEAVGAEEGGVDLVEEGVCSEEYQLEVRCEGCLSLYLSGSSLQLRRGISRHLDGDGDRH